MIPLGELRYKETRLTEALLSVLDAREAARDAGSSLIVYLADVIATRIHEELADVHFAVEKGARRTTL